MRDAARTLASYGRHGDDTLLHVSRKELEGIRALTGKGFTRNPETGLPEAFEWSSLIPVAAGIAGTVLSGGNPLVGAAASGLASAGTSAAQGATTEEALTQGLISGATSYAGGQLLAGVGDAANAAAQGTAQAAGQTAGQGAAQTAAQGATEGAVGAAQQAATAIAPSAGGYGPAMTGAQALDFSATGTAAPSLGQRLSAIPAYAENYGQTALNIASNPGAAGSRLLENVQAKPFPALIAGGGMLSQAGNMVGGSEPGVPGQEQYDPNRYPEQFPLAPRQWNAPPSGYRAGSGPEYRYFAEGGLASLRGQDGYTANLMNEAKAALLGEHPRPREALERFRETFGSDALDALRDRITGGRVRGAGGGMDDLIPGDIEGRQKVRLADGEFVIPSDVVSGLGDGSTDQGVRRLHGLMNKVRQQRTGKKAQPKSIGGKITL